MVRDSAVVTLPLAGRDQGWGVRATISGLPHPLPASPVEGEVPSGVHGNMEFTHV
jgi:hypothetical protein